MQDGVQSEDESDGVGPEAQNLEELDGIEDMQLEEGTTFQIGTQKVRDVFLDCTEEESTVGDVLDVDNLEKQEDHGEETQEECSTEHQDSALPESEEENRPDTRPYGSSVGSRRTTDEPREGKIKKQDGLRANPKAKPSKMRERGRELAAKAEKTIAEKKERYRAL